MNKEKILKILKAEMKLIAEIDAALACLVNSNDRANFHHLKLFKFSKERLVAIADVQKYIAKEMGSPIKGPDWHF